MEDEAGGGGHSQSQASLAESTALPISFLEGECVGVPVGTHMGTCPAWTEGCVKPEKNCVC